MKPVKSFALLFLLLLSFSIGSLSAQDHVHDQLARCGLHHAEEMLFLRRPETRHAAELATAQLEAETQQRSGISQRSDLIVIPIVFHVIHFNGPENISAAQVHDAVDVLNINMRALNENIEQVITEFVDVIADTEIEFRLAQKDPQGNCHPGINRIMSPLTFVGDSEMKQLIQWPRNKYLNVWVCEEANGAAGYALYPGSVNGNQNADEDGIVLQHSYCGSIGTSNEYRSRTLTHEVGHWLNLRHPWGNSNNPGLAENCDEDDLVTDTPNTLGWTSCNLEGSTCGSLDNVQNFMEYSYCGRMFTQGQKDRMRTAALSTVAQRNQLSTPANLEATGVAGDDVLCEAAFVVDRKTVCLGDSVKFTDASYHGPTSWTWEFGDGSSFSGTGTDGAQEVLHTYTEPGVYDVTLTVGNGTSEASTTVNEAVYVMDTGEMDLPVSQGFEADEFPSDGWSTYDPLMDGTWQVSSSAAATGNRSLYLQNWSNTIEGNIDYLRSSTIDVSGAEQVAISYSWAYVHKGSNDDDETDDRLRISVTGDCGGDWDLRKLHRGFTTLPSAAPNPFPWTPSGSEDWNSSSFALTQEEYLTETFRVQFEFEGRLGNNFYLDNINIYSLGTVDISDIARELSQTWSLAPNPSKGSTEVLFETRQPGAATIAIQDVSGRQVVKENKQLGDGNHRWSIAAPEAQGVYLVRLATADGAHRTWRWVVH